MNLEFATAIERSELLAWKDMYDCAPASFKENMKLHYNEIGGGLVLSLDAMPLAHFNMAISLGLSQRLDEKVLAEIMAIYAGKPPRSFMILYFDGMQPDCCKELFADHGLEAVGAWERIYRDNSPVNSGFYDANEITVEAVTGETAGEWAHYICAAYHLPFKDWLLAMISRNGWYHYIARKNGSICAVRSFFMTPDRWVWSGVEAPVPGIMTTNYTPDFVIWEHAIAQLNTAGARHYVADIERVSSSHDLESYKVFTGHFKFSISYTRLHYAKNARK